MLPSDLTDIRDDIKKLQSDVNKLTLELTQYKGFLGGVLWLGGALLSGLVFLANFFFK